MSLILLSKEKKKEEGGKKKKPILFITFKNKLTNEAKMNVWDDSAKKCVPKFLFFKMLRCVSLLSKGTITEWKRGMRAVVLRQKL